MKISYATKYMSLATVLLCFLMLVIALPAFAEPNSTTFGGGLEALKKIAEKNKLNTTQTSTKGILQTITQWLLSLVGTIAVISLLYGGFLYITSQGEEGPVEKAKHIILYSVIGIIIIGVSAIIVNVAINVATQ